MRKFLVLGICATVTVSAVDAAPVHDGDADFSFGIFGKTVAIFPGGAYIKAGGLIDPILQPDGKLLIAASKYTSATNTDFGVMRLMPNGSVDTGFGSNGAANVAFDRANSNKNDTVSGTALQPADGKILVAGFIDGDTSTDTDMAVARFSADGVLDVGFGSGGKAIVPFNLGSCMLIPNACVDVAYRVNLQSDGKILLVGAASTTHVAEAPTAAMAIARLTAGGVRDSSFDTDGRVTLDFGSAGDFAEGFQARQLEDGQHILVVGGANTVAGGTNLDFAMARLDNQGHLDTSFGNGGKVTFAFDVGGGLVDIAIDFIEQPDGKLFVCGKAQVNDPANYDFACMRFLANGTPDPAFTPLLVPFDRGGDFSDTAFALLRDSQGRLVVAGSARSAANISDIAVARLTAAGVLDTSFGHNGTATFTSTVYGTDYDNAATGVTIQPDDKIIVAGYAIGDAAGDAQFQVVRMIGDTVFGNGFEGN